VDAGKSPATLSHDVAVAPDAALMPIPVCTENLIHVDEVTESPKLVE
jgi:hypothetical protein